ncbi:MAG: SDR family NAD(P)-dependent oxidoreductase, partial [Calditrichota bacterium]
MSALSGKIAVVTGGNSGIGYAAAKDFIENGATVVITGRNNTKVEEAAAALGATGIVADQSNLSDIDNLAKEIESKFGKIDILFINAGIFAPAPLGSISEELFDNIMNINFKGAVFTLQSFLPVLKDGASVINLSSVNAYTGMTNTAIYGASKAALNSFTRTAATELAPRKIRVNAVNPGPVETPIFGKTGLPEEDLNAFASAIQQ